MVVGSDQVGEKQDKGTVKKVSLLDKIMKWYWLAMSQLFMIGGWLLSMSDDAAMQLRGFILLAGLPGCVAMALYYKNEIKKQEADSIKHIDIT